MCIHLLKPSISSNITQNTEKCCLASTGGRESKGLFIICFCFDDRAKDEICIVSVDLPLLGTAEANVQGCKQNCEAAWI